MTTPQEHNDESLAIVIEMRDKLLEFIESSQRADAARDSRVDSLHELITAVNARADAHGRVVDAVSNSMDATNGVIEVVNQGLNDWMTKLDNFESKVDGVRDDLGLVKGGHARNAMIHNLPRIADEFGFQFIAAMPQTTIIEFAKMAKALGEAENQIASFKSADMVMHVLDAQGQPAYVAIEASFTVDGTDVNRAVRNANYLNQFTGLSAFPAIAGVAVMDDAQAEVDNGNVYFYKIRPGELQSE